MCWVTHTHTHLQTMIPGGIKEQVNGESIVVAYYNLNTYPTNRRWLRWYFSILFIFSLPSSSSTSLKFDHYKKNSLENIQTIKPSQTKYKILSNIIYLFFIIIKFNSRVLLSLSLTHSDQPITLIPVATNRLDSSSYRCQALNNFFCRVHIIVWVNVLIFIGVNVCLSWHLTAQQRITHSVEWGIPKKNY